MITAHANVVVNRGQNKARPQRCCPRIERDEKISGRAISVTAGLLAGGLIGRSPSI
jgi:hypothetical protein